MRLWFFFFQAEDGIRDLVRSRGLGDVYKRQVKLLQHPLCHTREPVGLPVGVDKLYDFAAIWTRACLLYTSDAADERSSVDLGGRRIIKKKKREQHNGRATVTHNNHNRRQRVKERRKTKQEK